MRDRYLDWDANRDCCGVVRREDDGTDILADIHGPGVLWRMWSAQPQAGHVRLYLDGAAVPVTDLPFADYFGAAAGPFRPGTLVYETAGGGRVNYTPVPFRASLRIAADPGWGKFYGFTYTTFPPGTAVPSWPPPPSRADAAALAAASARLDRAGEDPAGRRPGERTEQVTLAVPPGRKRQVLGLDGAGAITALKVRLDGPGDAAASRRQLDGLRLRITWDDDDAPAVWSPLGDFFGVAAGAGPYRSLPLGLTEDGTFYSYWYMPFARHARLAVENSGPTAVTLRWRVTYAPLDRPAEAFARFHAKWHRNAFLPARADRVPDWTVLTTRGRGRFVGTHLHVFNGGGGWWGEGDDKFFVDGEKFPSSFGTGTEDYFGFAWSSSDSFSRPYHGQLLNEGDRGHADEHRWHIPDNVPFQTGFDGFLEKYFPDTRPTRYAAVAYWYLAPGGTDPYGPVPVSGP